MRHYHSARQYGVNAMAMIALYQHYKTQTNLDLSFLPEQDYQIYTNALAHLQAAARTYLEAVANNQEPAGLEQLLKRLRALEVRTHNLAIPLANTIKAKFISHTEIRELANQAPPAKPQTDAEWESFHRYTATQCMYLIQKLSPTVHAAWGNYSRLTWRNRFRHNAFSNSNVGIVQALIPVLANAIGIFSSYGCKSANDRAFIVAQLVHSLAQRIDRSDTTTQADITAIKSAIQDDFMARGTHAHSQLDLRGGTQKFSDTPEARNAPGFNSSKQISKAAPHMVKKKLKPKTTLQFASNAQNYNLDAALTETIRSLRDDYQNSCNNENRVVHFFRSHNRTAMTAHLATELSRYNSNNNKLRLLWLQYKAISRGQLKDLLKTKLVAVIEQFYGGLALRGKTTELAIEDALISNEIIPCQNSGYSLEQRQLEPHYDNAKQLNQALYTAIKGLLATAEKSHASPQGLNKLYQLVGKLNSYLILNLSEDSKLEDIHWDYSHKLSLAIGGGLQAFHGAEAFPDKKTDHKVTNLLLTLQNRLAAVLQEAVATETEAETMPLLAAVTEPKVNPPYGAIDGEVSDKGALASPGMVR